MTRLVTGSASGGARCAAVLGGFLALIACGGDPPTSSPDASAGRSESGASGASTMPAAGGSSGTGGSAGAVAGGGSPGAGTGGSAGTVSAAGGAGTGGVGGASGGAPGTAGAGSGGMSAGAAGTPGGSPSTGGAGAGGASSSAGSGSQALSFAADIWPVFEKLRDPVFVYYGGSTYESCVTSGVCHGGDDPGSGLSMTDADTAYANLLGVPSTSNLCDQTVRVVPGEPELSCLILFYEGRLRDELEWVETAEIDLAREWIEQGALP